MANGTLPEYISKNNSVDRISLCLQITDGLTYLHDSRRMVHGDLKGANILVDSAGILKLADFGNTKLKEQTLQFTTRTSPVYSLRWAAPEILNGLRCTPPGDVYALGMTIYETVTGNVPYKDKQEMAVIVEVLNHRRFPVRNDFSMQAHVDKDQLWDLLGRCWNYDGQLRPAAASVRMELGSIHRRGIRESKWTGISTLEQYATSRAHRRLIVVGDGDCGKSCLVRVLCAYSFPQVYGVPKFDVLHANVEVGAQKLRLALYDTPGQAELDHIRPPFYPNSRLILICFSIGSPDSLDNVQTMWAEEVHRYGASCPIVLIGCKKDLRNDPRTIAVLEEINQHPVTYQQGSEVAEKIGAKCYLECSAKFGHGVAMIQNYIAYKVRYSSR
ncbi:Tyrosine kinase specific for activated [Ceratobasidium sp. AG-Ba]|nr:Tyrosine kinase specific for activated [Ceratobasidium sp. AG-Ba]